MKFHSLQILVSSVVRCITKVTSGPVVVTCNAFVKMPYMVTTGVPIRTYITEIITLLY